MLRIKRIEQSSLPNSQHKIAWIRPIRSIRSISPQRHLPPPCALPRSVECLQERMLPIERMDLIESDNWLDWAKFYRASTLYRTTCVNGALTASRTSLPFRAIARMCRTSSVIVSVSTSVPSGFSRASR